ncbi:unnamed protein product [Moneuplotes crassus]|uniref:Uncharacterized protein n=1 Tax=Euplotes crassus TaxID=5936 RepID=A0AAD2CY66_EUPCR|nr:unnamed protein product [Moneuplotes crassus]
MNTKPSRPDMALISRSRPHAYQDVFKTERNRDIKSLFFMKKHKSLRPKQRKFQNRINIHISTCDQNTRSLERISNQSTCDERVTTSRLEDIQKLGPKILLESKRSIQGISGPTKFRRALNKLKMKLPAWHKQAKMRKIFDDVKRSVDSGQCLDLQDIGFKRTPIFKIQRKETLQREKLKRSGFYMNLKADQECIKSSKIGITRDRSYDSLEKALNEQKFRTIDETETSPHRISHPLVTRFLKSSEKTIGKHLKILKYTKGSFHVYEHQADKHSRN